MEKFLVVSVLACVVTALAPAPAEAALLNIVGGVTVSPVPKINNVVNDDGIGLTDPLGFGYVEGGQLITTANDVELSYFFMGFEAAWKNALFTEVPFAAAANNIAGGTTIKDLPAPGVDLFKPGADVLQTAAGALRFEFTRLSNPAAPGPRNLISNDGVFVYDSTLPLVVGASLGFQYVNAAFEFTNVPTDTVAILLDDSGAGPDDNHDDWVGYVVAKRNSPVVVPEMDVGAAGSAVALLSGMLLLLSERRKVRD